MQSGRTVVSDNFFTSLPLAFQLKVRGMSIVGTMRANKPCIPKQLRPNPADTIGAPRYAFSPDATLLSVVTKKNKSVYILSTIHDERAQVELTPAQIAKERRTGIPAVPKEVINDFYNK